MRKYSKTQVAVLCIFGLSIYLLDGYVARAERVSLFERPVEPTLTPEQEYYEVVVSEISSTAIGRDGHPQLDSPRYTDVATGNRWLQDDDVVFGLDYRDNIVAFPQRIMVHHEIANISIGDEHFAITYSPLTGSALAYKTHLAAGASTMSNSGEVVNSNLIMYDHLTRSYFPQILGRAINGEEEENGTILEETALVWTTWGRWKSVHPRTEVLSNSTSFHYDYGTTGDPYGSYLGRASGYYTSDTLLYPSMHTDERLNPKTVVVGIRDQNGNRVAISKNRIRADGTVDIALGTERVRVTYDRDLDSYTAQILSSGEWINAFDVMWFAWVGYYADTELVT